MNHVDEGTIHAWLDGALDATQARAVEMHVSQCAQCAAAVAEARGLIAGASRILTALDDVPAGVTPRRAMPPRRGWGASRWVTGIAAALILAVGVTTWNRNAVRSEMMPVRAAEPRVDTAQSAVAAPPVAEPVATAPQNAVAQKQSEVSQGTRARTGSAASRIPSPNPSAEGVAREKSPRLEDVVVTSANVGKVAGAAGAAAAAEFSALQRGAALQPADTSVAGCYRIATMEATARAEAPAEATRAQSKRSVAPAAAPAPGRADYPVRSASLLRLDTTRQAAATFDVRSMTNNAVLGSWRRAGRDSVRVDLVGSGTQTLARTDRVICP